MIVALGSIALDTTRTPKKTIREVLGGSGTYFSIAASFFQRTGLVGVVGSDFPWKYRKILSENVDITGLQVKHGKTFRYDSSFDKDLNKRRTLKTELNVFEWFNPIVPEEYRDAEYLYLGNINPEQQLKVLDQMQSTKFVVVDTIDFWIKTKRKKIMEILSRVNGVLINEDEVKLLCGDSNILRCSNMVLDWGLDFVIVKKGEHGAILSTQKSIFPSPAYPIVDVVDPTGAGDSFAGGFMGHITGKKTIDEKSLKEAVIYGNVMGSFAVEDFSVNRFLSLKKSDIDERFQAYKKLIEL